MSRIHRFSLLVAGIKASLQVKLSIEMAGRRAVIGDEDKNRIYAAFNRGEDYLHFAEQLEIKRQTAYAIVRRAEG